MQQKMSIDLQEVLLSYRRRIMSAMMIGLIFILLLYGLSTYQRIGNEYNFNPMYLQVSSIQKGRRVETNILQNSEETRMENGTVMQEKRDNGKLKTQLIHACDILKKRNETVLQEPGRLDNWIKSDRFKLIACRVFKVASTNIGRVMYALDHLEEEKDSNKIQKGTARHNSALEKKFYNTESFETEFKSYVKFMFVRDPLERLLSAYRGKSPYKMFESNAIISFTEFLEKVLSIPDEVINKHLVSFTRLCSPCSIKYDFIGSVDNFNEDMREILELVNAPKYVILPERDQTGYLTEHSSDILQLYLKDIPKSIVKRFYEKYYWDYFLFGFNKPDY